MSNEESKAIDVWLRIPDGSEEAEMEANTFRDEAGRYRVEWYHTGVGVVSSLVFDTYAQARAWLTREGFEDYTS